MANSIRTIHAKMDRADRAKQFMPFDALTGFRAALAKKERILVPKRDLSEEEKAALDQTLQQIRENDMVTVEFFENEEYLQLTGMVSHIDKISKQLVIINTGISFDNISNLQKRTNLL